jgi:Lysyl oxidase
MSPTLRRLLVPLVVGTLLIGATHARAAAANDAPLLPDLAQDPPSQVSVQQVRGPGGPEFRLGFRSAVRNIGEGALIIHGHRRDATAPMRADQLVKLAGGGSRRYRNVIPMRYAYTPTHNHFHVLRFDRYSLRDARTGRPVRPDHKSGFCLGDRVEVSLPRVHPPHYGPRTGECDFGNPLALRVVEGLTPGYLDDYGPQLEGQYIDVTGVPAGRYSLVHQVNADRRIRERDFRNDVAAALVQIDWPGGTQQPPAVTVLATCTHRAACAPRAGGSAIAAPAVPVLSTAETARLSLWCAPPASRR